MSRQHAPRVVTQRSGRVVHLLTIVACAVGSLPVGECAPLPPTSVRIDDATMTIGDLVDLVSAHVAQEIECDARARERRLYVSPGTYAPERLLAMAARASGLTVRSVDSLRFLALEQPSREGRVHARMEHVGALLEALAVSFDYEFAGIPFGASDFLSGRSFPLDQLSPAQLEYVDFQTSRRGVQLGKQGRVELRAFLQICASAYAPMGPRQEGAGRVERIPNGGRRYVPTSFGVEVRLW